MNIGHLSVSGANYALNRRLRRGGHPSLWSPSRSADARHVAHVGLGPALGCPFRRGHVHTPAGSVRSWRFEVKSRGAAIGGLAGSPPAQPVSPLDLDPGLSRSFGPGRSVLSALRAVLGGEDLTDTVTEGSPSAFVVVDEAGGVAAQVGGVGDHLGCGVEQAG